MTLIAAHRNGGKVDKQCAGMSQCACGAAVTVAGGGVDDDGGEANGAWAVAALVRTKREAHERTECGFQH